MNKKNFTLLNLCLMRTVLSGFLLFFGASLVVLSGQCVTGNPVNVGGRVIDENFVNGEEDLDSLFMVHKFAEHVRENISVDVYGPDGVLFGSTTTDSEGVWFIDGMSATTSDVQVVFTLPSERANSITGAQSGTSVQHVNAGDCNVDYAINEPAIHCEPCPELVLTCYTGSSAGAAPRDDAETIIGINNCNENMVVGVSEQFQNLDLQGRAAPPSVITEGFYSLASEADTRSPGWIAWNSSNGVVYSAVYHKYGVGVNAGHMGEIYQTDRNGNSSLFLDLKDVYNDDNIAGMFRTYPANATSQDSMLIDSLNRGNVGLIGFTDIDISDDNTKLYVYNAYDRNIYEIPIDPLTGSADVSSSADIKTFRLPDFCPGNFDWGDQRPHQVAGGLGIRDGIVYATTTCAGPSFDELEGRIYSFDPEAASPTYTLEGTIDYSSWTRYQTMGEDLRPSQFDNNRIQEWKPNHLFQEEWTAPDSTKGQLLSFAPNLMDIEFHDLDSVQIMTVGTYNRALDLRDQIDAADLTAADVTEAGEIHLFCSSDGDNWNVESNGSCLNLTTGLDPQGVMFQSADFPEGVYYHGQGYENRMMTGSLTNISERHREIVGVSIDAAYGDFDGGFQYHRVDNGFRTRTATALAGRNFPDDDGFGKQINFGDIEALCSPAPLEIGNYVWEDDGDGRQEAGEDPIAGVMINLYLDSNGNGVIDAGEDTPVATTTTAADGSYYFSSEEDNVLFNLDYIVEAVPPNGTSIVDAAFSDDLLDTDGTENAAGNSQVAFSTGAPGESDHSYDFAFQAINDYDLALRKTVATGQSGPFAPGDDITFTITVFNQGTVDVADIGVVDYIPESLVLNDTDWTLDNTTNPNQANLNVNIATLAAGDSINVPVTFTIDQNFTGTSILNTAEISGTGNEGMDVDSTPDKVPDEPAPPISIDNGVNDDDVNTGQGDEDDNDAAEVPLIYDLALKKLFDYTTYTAPFTGGDTVEYTIRVFNQGSIVGTDIEITDYIPSGMDLIDADWTIAAGQSYATNNTKIASLAPADSTDVSIRLRVKADYDNADMAYFNVAEISNSAETANGINDIDSTPDSNPDEPGPPGSVQNAIGDDVNTAAGDQDDNDYQDLPLGFDLALIKQLGSDGPFNPGDDVTFNIRVINQGLMAATGVTVVDYIPNGLVLNDANWSAVSNGETTRQLPGTILPGGVAITSITFTISEDFAGDEIINFAEIASTTTPGDPVDIDSTPDDIESNDNVGDNDEVDENGKEGGDEDDQDFERIVIEQLAQMDLDLALTKTLADPNAIYELGDSVTYNITIINQGQVVATDISVIDYFPDELTLADDNWTIVNNNTSDAAILNTNIASLGIGEQVIRTVRFRIDQDFEGETIRNTAEISGVSNDQDDVDSTPDSVFGNDREVGPHIIDQDGKEGGDEDDEDWVVLNLNRNFDLALTKTLANMEISYGPGDFVTYTIEVFNQGQIDATDVQVGDYIPDGLILADTNWEIDPNTPDYAVLRNEIPFIQQGTSTTRQIRLQISPDFEGDRIRNTAEISSVGNPETDIDSTPDDNETNDNEGDPHTTDEDGKNGGDEDDHDWQIIELERVFDLALRKTVRDPKVYAQGESVTFEIEVFNQGELDATNVMLIDYIPDGLTLNDTRWVMSGSNAILRTSIAQIEVGASVVQSITFTVEDDFEGSEISNLSEITGATNIDNELDDDSVYDTDSRNDNLDDNKIFNENGDEDDHDIATIRLSTCPPLTCISRVQKSISGECLEQQEAIDLLKNADPSVNYSVELYTEDGEFVGDTLRIEYVNTTLKYKVVSECDMNSCWGSIILEANSKPYLFSHCDPTLDSYDPAECTVWCSGEDVYPDEIVTPKEATEMTDDYCGATRVGDVIVQETREGDMCEDEDGVKVTLTYSAKFNLHGEIELCEILNQEYYIQKLDLLVEPFDSMFGFPKDFIMDCVGDAEPDAILENERYGIEYAYPYLIDMHRMERRITNRDTSEKVLAEETLRDTMVHRDVDGDGVLEWVVLTVVDKWYRDSTYTVQDTGAYQPILVPINYNVCNIQSSKQDIDFEGCGNGRKIVRTWTLIDWCDTKIQVSDRQTIEMKDTEKPEILSGLDTVILSIDPWTCSARYKLPDVTVRDNCDDDVDINFLTIEGKVDTMGGYITDLWISDEPHEVTIVATDACGNEDRHVFYIDVRDLVAPTPVLHNKIDVSISFSPGNEPLAKIYADAFDAGSNDANCGDVFLSVVRMEDYEVPIYNCNDSLIGFEPQSCNPHTVKRYRGQLDPRKNTCDLTVNPEEVIPVWGSEYVEFCCDDVDNDSLMVRVFVKDEAGNVSWSMVRVDVVNKAIESINCLPVTIKCYADVDTVKAPTVFGAMCGESSFPLLLNEVRDDRKFCGGGTVVKEYYLDKDGDETLSAGDITCNQIIHIESDDTAEFDPYSIKWPKHYDGSVVPGINYECDVNEEGDTVAVSMEKNINMGSEMICTPGVTSQRPVWCTPSCGVVEVSSEITELNADDACKKIIVRWTVIDWCKYNPNGDNPDDDNDTSRDEFIAVEDWAQGHCTSCPKHESADSDPVYWKYKKVDVDGYYTFDQVIKVIDQTNPQIQADSLVVIDIYDGAGSKTDDHDDCHESQAILATASDYCEGTETTSNLYWDVVVTDKDGEILNSRSAQGLEFTMSSGEGKPGDVHFITWKVRDACNNISTRTTRIEFIDSKNPSPICISGITTRYMDETGTVTIWGNEFDLGSFDNCTPYDSLDFSIVRNGQRPIMPGEDGYGSQGSIELNCDNMANFASLDIWIFDESGNGDFCTVGLLVSGECTEEEDEGDGNGNDGDEPGSTARIAGEIRNMHDTGISGAEVTISSNLPEYPVVTHTDSDGQYSFDNVELEGNYRVSVEKDGDDRDGISVGDLAMIQRHIVDARKFDSPYLIIAADANSDEKLSSIDIVELKKLILGIIPEFTSNTTWRFVDANQSFYDESSPFPFNEELNIVNLQDDKVAESYMGVKIGDVNFTADENRANTIVTRSNDAVKFTYDDRFVRDGETVTLTLNAENFSNISGYQFTLSHDKLKMTEASSALLNITKDDYHTMGDKTAMLWFSDEVLSVENSDELLTLTLVATEDVQLSDVLRLTSDITEVEAVKGKDSQEVMNINLDARSTSFDVAQNEPNPFSEVTNICFTLDSESEVSLSIYDMTGRVVYELLGQYGSGSNSIRVQKNDIGSAGIYYYTVGVAGGQSITKKMIIVE